MADFVYVALNFSQSLNQVESVQSQMGNSISSQSQLLKEINEGLVTNVVTFKKAIEQLDGRLSSLKK